MFLTIPERNAKLRDGQTHERTDKQTDKGDFIEPFVGRGSTKNVLTNDGFALA